MEEPEHGKHKHEHGKHKHKVKFTKLYIIEAVKLKLKEIDTTNLPNNSIDFTQLITKNIIIKSRESIGSLDLTPEQLIYFLLARPKIEKNHENNNDYKKDKHIKLYLKKLIIISLEYVKSKIPIDYYINAITNLVNELEFPNGLKKEIIEILKYPQALLDPIKMQKVINYNNKFFSKKNNNPSVKQLKLRNINERDWRVMFSYNKGDTIKSKLIKPNNKSVFLNAEELFQLLNKTPAIPL